MKLTVSKKLEPSKMAVYMGVYACEHMQVCVPLWVTVCVIWEEDENIGVSISRTSRARLFSGSLAMLIERNSFIKSHDFVLTCRL